MTIVRVCAIVAVIIVARCRERVVVFYDVSMHAWDKGASTDPVTTTLVCT
jgi:hypothetical protein